MWKKTNCRLTKFVKYNNEKQLDELSHQQAFDILEGFAYTKKGHTKTLMNMLLFVKDQFDTKKEAFSDIDEAILLANAIVEIKPLADKGTPEFNKIEEIRIELLQMSIDYMADPIHGSQRHADQLMLIFNMLLSRP